MCRTAASYVRDVDAMSGSSIGKLFVVTNFGESHGPAIGCVIDGCPAGLLLTEADIQVDLDRRRPGQSKFVTQRNEADAVQILSGVYEGVTTGTPIALLIKNTDQRSKDYSQVARQFRPSHADWSYSNKYGVRDPRGGGRSSARLTAPTVAAGAVARKWLKQNLGMTIRARISAIGSLELPLENWEEVNRNPFFAANASKIDQVQEYLQQFRKEGNSIGAKIEFEVTGVPIGLGNPIYDRLDARLAYALMGINAVKGVEIGNGFEASVLSGSDGNDQMTSKGFLSNNAGGILGGISSGAPIRGRVAVKATPSILIPLKSLDTDGQEIEVVTKGRHDPCVGIRAVPVVEAVLALTLIDAALAQRAQCGNFGVSVDEWWD